MTKNLETKLKHYGLSLEEYKKALAVRKKEELTDIEWALFSALWSEHCSYKSSKVHLKNIFNQSKRLVSEDGENAGVVDLGEGERVAFKMESHNHPSFIEPFQGAATGVGGILRDIFTMGARPIALANYLCFGEKESRRIKELVQGVVSGISFYGNCVGVPNITGQTEFHNSYNSNNLVNAFALGYYGKNDKIVSSKIKTPGASLVYVGAKTGKDGVHGASMASESFDEGSEAKRPTIQIGDPFFEKCLIESCLEVMKKELCESVQDMGAAGLTSSSFEMANGGGLGLTLDLSKVPLRDKTMTPEEILLSESQERMLMACPKENVEEVKKVFSKWGLEAVEIGEVRKEKEIQLLWQGDLICEIDPADIVEKAPRYERDYEIIEWKSSQGEGVNYNLKEVLATEAGCERNWIYDQYDQRVGAKTVSDCSEPLGVVKLPESKRLLGIALGCRPAVMRLSPVIGGKDSVLYPALQLSAKGFEPWAVTDCLNFGNPQKKPIMSEFVTSLRSMSEVCKKWEAPIISGNVSLYNETEGKNITSTPATGVVGLNPIESEEAFLKSHFMTENSEVYLLETKQMRWSGYAGELKGLSPWGQGDINEEQVIAFSQTLCEFVRNNMESVFSTRVVGKFGPLYALSKMVTRHIGITLDDKINEEFLKTESMYQVLIEVEKGTKLPEELNPLFLGITENSGELKIKNITFPFYEIKKTQLEAWEKHFGN